jgi:23S rRNA pseudouridine955/2504/2580 synthase
MLIVNAADENLRLDKFLCKKFDISFGLAQKLIREKKVKLNNAKCDASYKIQVQDKIEISIDLKARFEKEKTKISDEKFKKFSKLIIFEDDNLIAINKPSGLATQGGSGIEISVDDFARSKNYQLVHRLDKDTSGILLIAKNKNCAEILTEKFKNKIIKKTYLALIDGNLKKEFIEINIPLLKKINGKNEKIMPDFENGKEAISHLKLIKNFANFALVEFSPLTGRTHQLRVHAKEIGHAIINDFKYGGQKVMHKNLCKRLCLHALEIEINDYFNKKLIIKTKLPEFYPQF